ncbi:DUF1302 domain-containing protein [Azoarcus sp. L1K30]|uniref:DUF1302 domain-containing protein n=1 Tax=Azoarcus sp. L1K30 TaxID=2820277 RepID=UPI001B81F8C7|nr:DUF1302 domain-containing protein [Azoarcus sp. L1K30]MBR0567285.1 DUF1302 domain-containing protein [Azoarcus sp. L1K30]
MYTRSRGHGLQRACLALAIAGFGQAAHAGDFRLGDEVTGTWTLNASLGTNIRMQGRDAALTSFGNANHNDGKPGTGGGSTDDGDLNFDRNDVTSTTLKVVGDAELRYRNYGALIRAKAWHDFTLSNTRVDHGHFDNGYVPGTRLNDDHFDDAAKFTGAEILDAFIYGDWELGENTRLNMRLGNQVVNWGESIFIQGVNVVNPIDVPAARRAGAQVREILLPVPLLYGNLGLPGGVSLEAFYQLQWKKTVIDGCGTFFSPADVINCGGSQFGPDAFSDREHYDGIDALGGLNVRSLRLDDAKPSDAGQYGLALHWLEPESETDIGLYYVNYHTRTPFLSLSSKPSEPGSLYGSVAPLSYRLDYSAENIKTFGLSLSNTLGGASVMAELSYTLDLPVQINGGDLVQFGVSDGTQGPLVGHRNYDPAGATILGYDRMDKIQLQLGAINVFSQVLGAQSLLAVGEVGFSWAPDLPDAKTGVRYGRAFTFGTAWHPSYTNPALATPAGCSAANIAGMDTPANCAQDGFVTPFAWGYRLLGELEYPNAIAGWTAKPRLYWSHDVHGNAADGTFLDNRRTLGTGLALSRLSDGRRWTVDIAYTRFIDGARWDTNRDKDFLAASLSVAF